MYNHLHCQLAVVFHIRTINVHYHNDLHKKCIEIPLDDTYDLLNGKNYMNLVTFLNSKLDKLTA